MGKFRFEINAGPEDVPRLDDVHKRDCTDVLTREINRVFKYTLILSAAAAAFFGAYSLFSFTYLMRMEKMLPQLSAGIPIAAVAAFLLEFVSGTMRKWALTVETALHVLLILAAILHLQSLWIVPFAAYGVFLHIRLISQVPLYQALSEQEGFPEFTPLPIGDTAVKKEKLSENGENIQDVPPKQ